MRPKTIAFATTTLVATVTFFTRHHLHVLYELGHQYSTFATYLKNHPDTLFRYPNEPGQTLSPDLYDAFLPEPVPKIIHQIYLTNGRPIANLTKYEAQIESCKHFHPEWNHKIWTDEPATAFIAEHYPDLAPHYNSYNQNIQRANVLRIALLHHYGGVFFDLDITCRSSLSAPLDPSTPNSALTHLPLLTPGASPAGVNNAFILAQKGHSFLKHLLDRAPARDLWWPIPYAHNMFSTGCEFFSDAWMSYQKVKAPEKGNRTFILADQQGRLEPFMLKGKVVTPLLEHGGESSWHRWDKRLIFSLKYIFVDWPVVGWGGVLVGVGLMWVVGRLVRGSGSGKRRRSRVLFRASMDKTGLVELEDGRSRD
ncbi:Inositol phosphoceramide mannosyltransferase 3 [Fulvia fulva]|nr:Inositol phosphoceramide mannosyltransferase 3 [Fulvia fulva]